LAVVRGRRQLAGVRLVECPETHGLAAVTLDRLPALMAALVNRPPEAGLASCSRWPDRGRCEEPCLPQARDRHNAVSDLVARWSADKRCTLCGGRLADASAVGHHVALRATDGITREWPDLDPVTVPDAMRASQPVCWNCHVAETFRRTHPELITDR
jgi:hypothetical protein